MAMSVPSFFSNVIPAGSAVIKVPLGPFARTPSGRMLISTPLGTTTGLFPIRDMIVLPCLLPDLAQDFAAHFFLLGGASRHQPFGRGENVDAHAAEHARHFAAAHID